MLASEEWFLNAIREVVREELNLASVNASAQFEMDYRNFESMINNAYDMQPDSVYEFAEYLRAMLHREKDNAHDKIPGP